RGRTDVRVVRARGRSLPAVRRRSRLERAAAELRRNERARDVTVALGIRGIHGRSRPTIVRNFCGLSPGFCLLWWCSPRSQSAASKAALVVLKATCMSPHNALMPVGLLAVE